MSTSYSIVGMRPPDEKWKEMKAVWDACKAANVEIPDAVGDFFDDDEPDPKGIAIDLLSSEHSDEFRNWHTLSISDIPNNITEIRFVESW